MLISLYWMLNSYVPSCQLVSYIHKQGNVVMLQTSFVACKKFRLNRNCASIIIINEDKTFYWIDNVLSTELS